MELNCTRPSCPRPVNPFPELSLSNRNSVKAVQQKFCTACGMPLILGGQYLPQRLLGRGGFGAAYYAVNRYSPTLRPCVVKIFQPDGDLNPEQLELAQRLFEGEAIALEQLGNANRQIPDLLAYFSLEVPSMLPGKQEELFYLVQEYIDGQSLEQELSQRGPFSEVEVLEVLEQTLKVLQFVHERNSIHRDIKPSNIMRDGNDTIYLLDFGAVKQVTQSAAGAAPKASTGIYSMGYAPPEQMQGGRVYPATDLYALGATALVLLTGKEPEELRDHFHGRWDYGSHVTLSPGLGLVLNKMLEEKPSDRFDSAATALKALALIQGQLSSSPNPPPLPNTASSANATAASPLGQSPPPLPSPAVSTQPPPLPQQSAGSQQAASGQQSAGTQMQSSGKPYASPPPLPVSGLPIQASSGSLKPSAGAAAISSVPPTVPNPSPAAGHGQAKAGQVVGNQAAASQPSSQPSQPAPLSLPRLLGNALFTGMEGSLLAVAIASLLGTSLISSGAWLVLFVGMIFLQYFRILGGVDLPVILVLTLVPVLWFGLLPVLELAILVVAAGLVTLALTLFFQVVYRLLRQLL